MKAAAEFCLDWLIDDGQRPARHRAVDVARAGLPTPGRARSQRQHGVHDGHVDHLGAVHATCLEAARILRHRARASRRGSQAARAQLYPLKIGARGQLQEWFQDFMETEVHHRHPSHLFGVYPGRRITPATPAFFAAARRALEIRGDDGTGWSLGWKINLWARFRDGDRAYLLVKNLLRPVHDGVTTTLWPGRRGLSRTSSTRIRRSRSTATSRFTSGVSEMLLQSRLSSSDERDAARAELELLPALPAAWPAGSVRGLRARGSIELAEMTWAAGKLTSAAIVAHAGGAVRVRYQTASVVVPVRAGERVTFDARLRPRRDR